MRRAGLDRTNPTCSSPFAEAEARLPMGNLITKPTGAVTTTVVENDQKDRDWLDLLLRCDQFLTDTDGLAQAACSAEMELRGQFVVGKGYRSDLNQVKMHSLNRQAYEELVNGVLSRNPEQIVEVGIQNALLSLVAMSTGGKSKTLGITESVEHALVTFHRIKLALKTKIVSFDESPRKKASPFMQKKPGGSPLSTLLSDVGFRMGLVLMKSACRTDPMLFQESLDVVQTALADFMEPLSLFNDIPLSPDMEKGLTSLRSSFVEIAMNEASSKMSEGVSRQLIRFLLKFGISRGSASDILHAIHLILAQTKPFDDEDIRVGLNFLRQFSPPNVFSPFIRGNESASVGLRLDPRDIQSFDPSSMACDGQYLFVHCLSKGLLRIHCAGPDAGKLNGSNADFHLDKHGVMDIVGGFLVFFYRGGESDQLFYLELVPLDTLVSAFRFSLSFAEGDTGKYSLDDGSVTLTDCGKIDSAAPTAAPVPTEQEEVSDEVHGAADTSTPNTVLRKPAKKSTEKSVLRKPDSMLMGGHQNTLFLIRCKTGKLTQFTLDVANSSQEPRLILSNCADLVFVGKHAKIGSDEGIVDKSNVVAAINCGGEEFVDGDGNFFLRDQFYGHDDATYGAGGGYWKTHEGKIDSSPVCHSCRWRKGSFWYNIPVPNGAFVVSLIFCEIESNKSQHRQFDVFVEGESVMQQFSPYADHGGMHKPQTYHFPVNVFNHKIEIRFTGNNPAINGILIRRRRLDLQSMAPGQPTEAIQSATCGWGGDCGFLVTNGKELLIGKKEKQSHTAVTKFDVYTGQCLGQCYVPSVEGSCVCMDATKSYFWKLSKKSKIKVQRFLNHAFTLSSVKTKTTIASASEEFLKGGSIDPVTLSSELLQSMLALAKHSEADAAFFPLCLEVSSNMFSLVVQMVRSSMDNIRKGQYQGQEFKILGLLMEYLNVHLSHAHSLNRIDSTLTRPCKESLKAIVFEILSSADPKLDGLLDAAADIFTSSLETFISSWESKIDLLCQILGPTEEVGDSKQKLSLSLNTKAQSIVGKCLLSRCNDLEMIYNLFNYVHEERDGIEKIEVLAWMEKIFKSLLNRLLGDFKEYLAQIPSHGGYVPPVSVELKNVIEITFLVHSYFMSSLVDTEEGLIWTDVASMFMKHLANVFDTCANAAALSAALTAGNTMVAPLSCLSNVFGKIWYQGILFCCAVADNINAAEVLVRQNVLASGSLLDIFRGMPEDEAGVIVNACSKCVETTEVVGFPYTLGPVDDLPDQATWGTAYALMDYPALLSGRITTVSARFGSMPQGNNRDSLKVRIFQKVEGATSSFRFVREQDVPIDRKLFQIDTVVDFQVPGGGLRIDEGEFPALYNPCGSLNIRTRKKGAPQRTIYYTTGSAKKTVAIGETINFTGYSNKDNRGALLPGWYATVEPPLNLLVELKKTGDPVTAPRAEDESNPEVIVTFEYMYLYQLTRYQSWLASKLASTLIKGSPPTSSEIKNEAWFSSSIFEGNYVPEVSEDIPAPPSLKRSVSAVAEESTFIDRFTNTGGSSSLLAKLEEVYEPNPYITMLRRKGGAVVDATLRSCFLAVAQQTNLFENALAFEICAEDGDAVPETLLNLWGFIQEKRQWFIREHEQLAGTTYEAICADVETRVEILTKIKPVIQSNMNDGSPLRRSMKHRFMTPSRKENWQTVERSLHERNELSKMLQERSFLLSEKQKDEEPRDRVISFLLSNANAQQISSCLSQRRIRARRRVEGFVHMRDLMNRTVVCDSEEVTLTVVAEDLGNILATTILQNCSDSILANEKGGVDVVIKSWSANDAIVGCGARHSLEICNAQIDFCLILISVLRKTAQHDDVATSLALKQLCLKCLCVRYSFNDKDRRLATSLVRALRALLQPSGFVEPTKGAQRLPNEPFWKENHLLPAVHGLYEFLTLSSIAVDSIFHGTFLIELFNILGEHLNKLMSILQDAFVTEDRALPFETGISEGAVAVRYISNTPVFLHKSRAPSGLVIPRPPSLDKSFAIRLNVRFSTFDRECDTALFKQGNFHKCTENEKSQVLAKVDRKTNKVVFISKVRKAQEVQITQVESDSSLSPNKWHSLLFARILDVSGKDALYVFVDGACSTNVRHSLQIESGSYVEGNELSSLPLYVGVPPVSPHHVSASVASNISDKYVRENDQTTFVGTIAALDIIRDKNCIRALVESDVVDEKCGAEFQRIVETHEEIGWALNVFFRCTQVDNAKSLVSRPRMLQSMLSILLGTFDASQIVSNDEGLQPFDCVAYSSPTNKLQAARVLKFLLRHIEMKSILSSQFISSYWSPQNILENLFRLYTQLDCVINAGEFDAGTLQCDSRYSALLMCEVGCIFQSLATTPSWSTIMIDLLCSEIEKATELKTLFAKRNADILKKEARVIWRVLSALNVLCSTSGSIRIGAEVQIKGESNDPKLPSNRSGLVVGLDEQAGTSSILLSDGEIVENIPLQQLVVVPAAPWVLEGGVGSKLDRVFVKILPLVSFFEEDHLNSLLFVTFKFRLMQLLHTFVEMLPSVHEAFLANASCVDQVIRIACETMAIKGEFGIFSELSQKMESLRLLSRDVNLTFRETMVGLETSDDSLNPDSVFIVKSVSPLIDVTNELNCPLYSVQADLGEEWECPQCDSPNPVDITNCEMCDFDRPELAGVIIGHAWPKDSSMDMFHIPCLSKQKFSKTAAAQHLAGGFGVIWQGQASLSRTIKSQKTESFSFLIKQKPLGGAFVRTGFIEDADEPIDIQKATDIYGWCSDGSILKPSSESKTHENIHSLNVSYASICDDTSVTQYQTVTKEGTSGPFLCSVKRHFPVWTLDDVQLKSGKWYYEVEVIGDVDNSCPQIGWADALHGRFDGQQNGVGDCKHSWGVDGFRVKSWNEDDIDYGKKWTDGDRVGFRIDLDSKIIGFSLNNEYMGDAYTECEFSGGVFPAFTISAHGKMKLRVFFGGTGKLKYDPPEGFNPIYEYFNITHEKQAKIRSNWTPVLDAMTRANINSTRYRFDGSLKQSGIDSKLTTMLSESLPELSRTPSELLEIHLARTQLSQQISGKPRSQARIETTINDEDSVFLKVGPPSSACVDASFAKSFSRSGTPGTTVEWAEGNTVTVKRDYESSQISIFLGEKLLHEISPVPATFLHPFIEISGAGVSVCLNETAPVVEDISDDMALPWKLENAIAHQTVYFGILFSVDGDFTHLVRLFIRSDGSNSLEFTGHIEFGSIGKTASISGELRLDSNRVHLNSFSCDKEQKLQKMTYNLETLQDCKGRLTGISFDGESVMILDKKESEKYLSFRNPESHIFLGHLGIVKHISFTIELHAKFSSADVFPANLVCCYASSSRLSFGTNEAHQYSLDLQTSGGEYNILTFSEPDSDVWAHLAISYEPTTLVRSWILDGTETSVNEGMQREMGNSKGEVAKEYFTAPISLEDFAQHVSVDIAEVATGVKIGLQIERPNEGKDSNVDSEGFYISSKGGCWQIKKEEERGLCFETSPLARGDNVSIIIAQGQITFFVNRRAIGTFVEQRQVKAHVQLMGSNDRVCVAGSKFVHDGGLWSLFKDTKLAIQTLADGAVPSSDVSSEDSYWTVGGHGSENGFRGDVVEVRVWKKALRTADLEAVRGESYPSSAKFEGLMGWWPLVVGMGNVAYDVSGNGNHGLISCPEWLSCSDFKRRPVSENLYWSLKYTHESLLVDPLDASRIISKYNALTGRSALCDTPINMGKFKFDIEMKKLKNYAYIGISTISTPLTSFIGATDESWGLYSAGDVFHNNKKEHSFASTKYVQGDCVSVYVDTILGTVAWAINGQMLGYKCTNVRGKTVYPAITLFNSDDQFIIKRSNIDRRENMTGSLPIETSLELEKTLRCFEKEGLIGKGLFGEELVEEQRFTQPLQVRGNDVSFLGDIGDHCASPMSNNYDGSFEDLHNGKRKNSELVEGAQRLVCVQGSMWRLAIVSQMMHTSRALTVMLARQSVLHVIKSSATMGRLIVNSLSGGSNNILKYCQLILASSDSQNIEILGQHMPMLLDSSALGSNSMARSMLASAISILMSSIAKMKAVYNGLEDTKCLDVIDDHTAIENPNAHFGFWLVRLLLHSPQFVQANASAILCTLLTFISFTEGTLRVEGTGLLVQLMSVFIASKLEWPKSMTDRVQSQFLWQLQLLYKSESSRLSKFTASLVHGYLELTSLDPSVLGSLPSWFNEVHFFFHVCEELIKSTDNIAGISKMARDMILSKLERMGFLKSDLDCCVSGGQTDTASKPLSVKGLQQLVHYLDTRSSDDTFDAKKPGEFNAYLNIMKGVKFDGAETSRMKAIAGVPDDTLKFGSLIICALNHAFEMTRCFLNFEPTPGENSLVTRSMKYRYFLFWSLKYQVWKPAIKTSYSNPDSVYEFSIDRLSTYSLRGKEATPETLNKSVFGQLVKHLQYINPQYLRHKSKDANGPHGTWRVDFDGESSIDQGGPFRDTLLQAVTDLEQSHVRMVVPVPNNRNNQGEFGRDKFVPNPTYVSSQHLQMWQFVGKLMGVALRINNPLPFNFPSIVWKLIVMQGVDRRDLRGIDESFCRIHESILVCAKGEVEEYEMYHQVVNNAGEEVPLFDGGETVLVTGENNTEYVTKCEQFRLAEFTKQCAAMREGLSTVVPIGLLNLWTWEQLESNVCGRKGFDIELLKKHAEFRDGHSSDAEFQNWLWMSLSNFSDEEKEDFLRFCWGRSRLPIAEDGWTHPFTVVSKRGDDDTLPSGHTCFFQIDIPRYSTQEIMEKRLKIALTWGNGAIDDD